MTKEIIEQIISKNKTVLVDFYAPWCGPCKMLKNILQNIEKKYPNVSFIKINVDDDAEIAHFFNISSIPAIFIYNEQKLVSSFKGFRDEEYISNELSKLN